ncbi:MULTISPECIES: hypothetical protein [Streptomyces]|uniref:Secreted protein n=1 Tax=Streptomyces koelreuteriae TaxID=2838015 RepID=A0ABX8G282_9ACTN|nr:MULTISPECIES: hypothetical protein [Streptomyces]QWB27464.1 hypothetical protein KJK29_35360 [Streptomyces koelreuteriae]UUA10551.1 hypothetical protein NNW98_35555 [Streptomyces koelreuteriae]UUA18158.1 hypothetical protein NNW99_35440 [Streptomyces sp. CRCS-T-1]
MTIRTRLRSATAALATAATLVLTAQSAVAAPQVSGRWDMPNGVLWAETGEEFGDVAYQRTGNTAASVSIGFVDTDGERRSHTQLLRKGQTMAFRWQRAAVPADCVTVFVQFTSERVSHQLCR